MSREIVIISSRSDPASTNISSRLQELADWETVKSERGEYRIYREYRLISFDGELIHRRGIESAISSLDLSPDLIVFAYRHKAKSGLPWLGGHFTGSIGADGTFEISAAAPYALKAFLCSIAADIPAGFSLSAEATHHGPTDIATPMFFAEIGSNDLVWSDKIAGNVVAKAILSLADSLQSRTSSPAVMIGFGGGHYVQRETELILETGAAFGHMFSKYQADMLSPELVWDAAAKSGASYAYIDRKSFRAAERTKYIRCLWTSA